MENLIQNLVQFVTQHWQLWLVLVVVLVLIFVNELFAHKKRAKELSASAAVEMINHQNAVVFDLRTAEIYTAGHIIDAIRVAEDDFSKQRMDKYKMQPIILVCARGIQSTALAVKLRAQGFTQPLVLAGGITAWQTANLPLVKGK